MSPFTNPPAAARPSLLGRLAARPSLIVFLLCLMLGLAAVASLAKLRADAAHTRARTEALARTAGLELQFTHAVTAAEVLGALARQNGGTIPNFQKVAGDLFAARPGLASLELQPGGAVSDIFPRSGQERFLGFNVLKDPAYGPGASLAVQRRALTVTGPLTLYRGVPGIVVRVPIFQRGRDNREYFWGFVAVSMKLPDALARAQLDKLWAEGYAYVLFSTGSARQNAIAARGELSLPNSVQQTVGSTGFTLALQPRNGWYNTTRVVLESLGALIISCLLGLMMNLLESRRAVEISLSDANRQLEREISDRKQAQEDCRGAKESSAAFQGELKKARLSLQQAESKLTDLQARLEVSEQAASRAAEGANVSLKQAERVADDLRTKLEESIRVGKDATQASQAKLEQTQAALQQAQEINQDLKTRLEAALQVEKKSVTAAQNQHVLDQAAITELRNQLDQSARAAKEAAETKTNLVQAEAQNRELSARLLEAGLATARVEELTALLDQARAELQSRQDKAATAPSSQATMPVTEVRPEPVSPPSQSLEPEPPAPLDQHQAPPPALQPMPSEVDLPRLPEAIEPPNDSPKVDSVSDESAGSSEPPSDSSNGEVNPTAMAAESAAVPAAHPAPEVPAAPSAPSSTENRSAEPSATAALSPEPPAPAKPAKVPKRKKVRQDTQIDLFGSQPPSDPKPPAKDSATLATVAVRAQPESILPPPLPREELSTETLRKADPIPGPIQPALEAPPVAPEQLEPPAVAAAEPALAEPETTSLVPSERTAPDSPPTKPMPLATDDEPSPLTVILPDFPPIEGLIPADGLAQAGGNSKAYLKALRQFAEEQVDAPEKIRDALVQGNATAAEKMAKALQVAAASIGAVAVDRTASALAHAILDQADPGEIEFLWEDVDKALKDLIADLKPVLKPKEEKPTRPLPAPPPVNPPQLRKAISQMLPLLTDQDPGAKDCLKDNRATFRSAFSPEGYVEFEQLIKSSGFAAALDHLKKAAKRHGIPV